MAGFDVVGVDIEPRPRYPFAFVQGDALRPPFDLKAFDFIWASPVCKRWSTITKTGGNPDKHPDDIAAVRAMLQASGKPYAIENVPEAPLIAPVLLCGTMFDLDVIRHRHIETYPQITMSPAACRHHKPVVKHGRRPDLSKQFHGVTGHFSGVAEARVAMGIDWMGQDGLSQAIPPAYSEWIAWRILELL